MEAREFKKKYEKADKEEDKILLLKGGLNKKQRKELLFMLAKVQKWVGLSKLQADIKELLSEICDSEKGVFG